MTKKIVTPPFVECPDNMRCGQTVILMILKHFYPNKKWTWKDADKICGYKKGKATSTVVATSNMIKRNFESVVISQHNHDEYLKDPVKYIRSRNEPSKAEYILKYANIPLVIKSIKEVTKSPHSYHINRDWNWDDIDVLLRNNFMIMAWVNAQKLYARHNQNSSTSGHFVLIYEYNSEYQVVFFHDGGSYVHGKQEFEMNRWKSGRIGLDYFMHAARNTKGTDGSSIVAFRPRKI